MRLSWGAASRRRGRRDSPGHSQPQQIVELAGGGQGLVQMTGDLGTVGAPTAGQREREGDGGLAQMGDQPGAFLRWETLRVTVDGQRQRVAALPEGGAVDLAHGKLLWERMGYPLSAVSDSV
jgi:hypothetical protein